MDILLIGNGFDLEHELPTSYKEFLEFCDAFKSEDLLYKAKIENLDVNKYLKVALLNYVVCDAEEIDAHIKEFLDLTKDNLWLKYFQEEKNKIGDNWIDFESEISLVIQIIDYAKEYDATNLPTERLDKFIQFSNILQDSLADIIIIEEQYLQFIEKLYEELERFIRSFEIYIELFINRIDTSKRSIQIENLKFDYVLSFNYTNTYERLYDSKKEGKYDYVHGKADINHNVRTTDLVLGIDEYLPTDKKDKNLEFLMFKKFYQRIYKGTGGKYLQLVDNIKDTLVEYKAKEKNLYEKSNRTPLRNHIPHPLIGEYPHNNLYIFGHSLDITDRDILKTLICNDNVQTKIFYYREDEDDKKSLSKLIKNLIGIMGQDEVIRRTGGKSKTIEFIPQDIS